ncbi:PfkB family carbohydrate kinase [Micromonosporaceae bacterium Da 78-11]
MTKPTAAVIGQLARDLVLSVTDLPEAGTSAGATARLEQLGGKGANQAVGLAQLGVRPTLIAVAGDDVIGDVLLDQARHDGIDVSAVVRRPGVLTGLIVEILSGTDYRYLEHLPLLTVADVEERAARIRRQDAVLVQLQQPADVAAVAARIGHAAGRLVVLDGAPADDAVLACADVVRADDKEARSLLGVPPSEMRDAARELLEKGPRLIAVAVDDGNLFVWADGHLYVPLPDDKVVDTTGGGDAFVAALTASLLRGESYPEAARRATAASGATVGHVGGRPDLAGTDARG